MMRFTVIALCAALAAQLAPAPAAHAAEVFTIQRGINISHWLSQSSRRGEARREFFTEKDMAFIAESGYDHVRLPIDEEQMWDEEGNREAEAFELLHNGIGWARDNGLRIVVDLHILRSHYFNADEKPLFTDPAAQDKFIALWEDLSKDLRQYPNSLVAYELMNEPVADDPEDWNKIVARAVKAVRALEPERKIVIGSNRWQSASTFDTLRVPENDPNIILSFHFYEPMLITHYRASWTSTKDYTGPVNYPGWIVTEENQDQLPAHLRGMNREFGPEQMREIIAKPLAVAKELGLPLYCGEWGCIEACPRDVRLKWYEDVRAMLEEHGIAWANWDYKGGFGIADGVDNPDEELIEILTGE